MKIKQVRVKGVEPFLLEIEEEDGTSKLQVAEITKDIRLKLSPTYRAKLINIERELGLSTREAIFAAIDLYDCRDSNAIKLLTKRLLHRIHHGVDARFLIQLKILYTAIGHFLKKIRYIK